MSKSYIQPGKIIDYVVAGAAVVSGDILVSGSLVGVIEKSGAIGDIVGLGIDGVYNLAKVTGTANTLGQILYWDSTAKKTTVVSSANTFIGYCADPANSAAAFVKVLLARPGS